MKLINLQYIILFTGLILSVTSFMIGDFMNKINHRNKEIIVLNQDNKKSVSEFQTTNITTTCQIALTTTTKQTTTKKVIITTKTIPTTTKLEEIIFDGLTESELTPN